MIIMLKNAIIRVFPCNIPNNAPVFLTRVIPKKGVVIIVFSFIITNFMIWSIRRSSAGRMKGMYFFRFFCVRAEPCFFGESGENSKVKTGEKGENDIFKYVLGGKDL